MSHKTRAEQKNTRTKTPPRPVRLHRIDNLTAHEIAVAVAEIEEGLLEYYEDHDYAQET